MFAIWIINLSYICNKQKRRDCVEEKSALLAHTNDEIEKLTRQYDKISNLRLGIGIIGLCLFILSVTNRSFLYLFGFIIAAIIFILLIVQHDKISNKKEYMVAKQHVLNKRVDRAKNQWNKFQDSGEEFLSENSNIERDLDIFGPNSLYQYLCVANTQEGKEKLVDYLTEQDPDFEALTQRQKAVKELIEQHELSLNLEIYSWMIGKTNKDERNEWYQSFLRYILADTKLLSTFIRVISWVLPVVMVCSCIFVAKFRVHFEILVVLFAIELILAYYVTYKNQMVTRKIFDFCRNISIYHKILETIEAASFESDDLKDLQKILLSNQRATEGISKLYSISEAFELQYNIYVHSILQGFLMYDVHCIELLESWKKEYRNSVKEWFSVIAEMEALLSLSMIGLNRTVSYPVFVKPKQAVWEGKEIVHPLIANEKAIPNSIQLRSETGIITGSNMSGKTTFLRTIGINTVLAYAGAPVCAESLQLSNMKLFTSMRVMDDVSKGISTFYAEVLRIKEMVDFSKSQKPCIILIDEIFKGTNSADRIVGSKEVIKNLSKPHTILLVSTHDFELCDLIEENDVNGKNYHFQEFYQRDQIGFDYKLKAGKCQTTNAKHILKMAGII
jgi:DNA mismatch repair ATPase MutS